MNKKIKSIIGGVMSASMIIAALTGCGGKKDEASSDSIVYWMELPSAATALVSNYGETAFAKEWQKRCNVTVEFQHPPQGQAGEKFNIMMASKNLPDVIQYKWANYPGGPEKAIKDGKIISLNSYVEKYAPEFEKYLEENPEIAKMCKTDDGEIFAFPFIRGTDSLCITQGLIVRKDWLDELGIEEPETIDEWENMLVKFKEAKGLESPYDIQAWIFQEGAFSGAYGVKNGYYVEDGKVKFGPCEPGFKDFVAKMNDWYSRGLITPDIATLDGKAIDSDILSGKTGGAFGALGGSLGKWLAGKPDDKFELTGLKYPVLKKGDKPKFNSHQLACPSDFIAITSSCKDPDKAAKFLSYGYTDEGRMFFNFGIEGESYDMKDGYPTYTENITKNSEGYTMSNMLAQYCQAFAQGPFIQDERYYEQYAGLPEQQDAWQKFAESDGINRTVPYIYFSESEANDLAKKSNAIGTYIDEQLCKYIMGVEPMDNYGQFTKKIEDLGIKEILASKQAAYDKYLSR